MLIYRLLLLFFSALQAYPSPNLQGTWNFQGTFFLQPLYEQHQSISQAIAKHNYPVEIEQEESFFIMKILSQHRQQLRGSHDPKKHKSEEWLCFFDHTQSNRFLCSDQDEPVWIEGIVNEQNNTMRINYVESGYHHNEWQNKLAVGRIKATRKS